MDDEMIERCRAVLWDKHCPDIRRTSEDDKFYTEVVIDVIKAMLEPTEKMLKPVTNADGFFKLSDPKQAWQAMIGAIINE